MQLAGVTVVKNEGDVIETFVRHNLRYLDHLYVLDHGSVDLTPAILATLAKEGLPISLSRSRAAGFNHHELMQKQVAHVFGRRAPDFLFLLDGDELISAPSRAALEAALRALPPETPGSLRWHTYLPEPGPGTLLSRMRFRPQAETNIMRKVVLPHVPRLQGRWQIAPGNHAARFQEGGAWFQPELPELEGVALAHLPLRSPAQAVSKAVIGWLGWRLSYGDIDLPGAERMGWHWRQWTEAFLRDGRRPSWEDLRREALRVYAYDVEGADFDASAVALVEDALPEPPGYRGLGGAQVDPARNLASWGAGLVESLLEARRERRRATTPR
jgi:hypothetical protein